MTIRTSWGVTELDTLTGGPYRLTMLAHEPGAGGHTLAWQAIRASAQAGAKVLADGLMGVIQQVTGVTDPVQATAAVTAVGATTAGALAIASKAAVPSARRSPGVVDP